MNMAWQDSQQSRSDVAFIELTSVSKTVLKFLTSSDRTWGAVNTPARAGEASSADIKIDTSIVGTRPQDDDQRDKSKTHEANRSFICDRHVA
jgi:hypothetical protein